MKYTKDALSVLAATMWISTSEFVRNNVLFKSAWSNHYHSLGLVFPASPVNGAVWGVWSFCLALAVYVVSTRYSPIKTTFLVWFMSFVMMWLVIGNLHVLPFGILWLAVPLSVLETYIAAWIVKKIRL